MRSLGIGPNPRQLESLYEGEIWTQRHTYHVKMKAKITVMHSESKISNTARKLPNDTG
jgi:hypothetical protein